MSKKEIKKFAVKEIRFNKEEGGIEIVPPAEFDKELYAFGHKKNGLQYNRTKKCYYISASEKNYAFVLEHFVPDAKLPAKSGLTAAIKTRNAKEARWAEEKAAKQAKPASKSKKAQQAKPADVDALLAKIGISREDLLVALLSK